MKRSVLLATMLSASTIPLLADSNTGVKQREEVFEFAQKPQVKRQKAADGRNRWVVTFASKAACDAAVAIADKDGKVIRHLAGGVLGDNAPAPFKAGSLVQEIVWDGLDDKGSPAPAGCMARVGLGLNPTFGMTINPTPTMLYRMSAIACDDKGNLYMAWDPGSKLPLHIRVYSRDGNTVRMVCPPLGDLKPEAYTGYQLVGPTENPFFVPRASAAGANIDNLVGMAVSPTGQIVLSVSGWRGDKNLLLVRTDGSDMSFGSQLAPWQIATGEAFLAFSPDETKVYVGAVNRGMNGKEKGYHAVFVHGLRDPLPKQWNKNHKWNGHTAAFAGDPDKSGNDNAHFNLPRGVATDKDGNVYVCDFKNDRVQVFSPDAAYLRTIPVERPEQIAVHRKTGAIYVMVPRQVHKKVDSKRFKTSRIIKFSADGKELYTFEFPGACHLTRGWITAMALDDSAEPAYIYIKHAEQQSTKRMRGLWQVADLGDKFEKTADLHKGGILPVKARYNAYIVVDPEEKYLYNKTRCKRLGPKGVERIDLETGKRDEKWEMPVVVQPMDEFYVDSDGLMYGRGCTLTRFDKGKTDEHVWRMDLKTGKEVPFSAAPNGRITFPGPFQGNFQRRGFCVAPDGDVFVLVYHGKGKVTLNQYDKDGKLKKEDLIPGYPNSSGSIRVDRAGNIYAAIHYPDGITPEILGGLVKKYHPAPKQSTGSLYKFGPNGGDFRNPTGYIARYEGIEPFAAGYASCSCYTIRHGLDGFNHVFAPITHLAAIQALDSNFNRIVRIGNYGNVDHNGPESEHPKPDIGINQPQFLWAGDRGLYIADMGNLRILCVDLGYHVEEAAPLDGSPSVAVARPPWPEPEASADEDGTDQPEEGD